MLAYFGCVFQRRERESRTAHRIVLADKVPVFDVDHQLFIVFPHFAAKNEDRENQSPVTTRTKSNTKTVQIKLFSNKCRI
jgi:hypothetical protein